jgi:hypothetical protein
MEREFQLKSTGRGLGGSESEGSQGSWEEN